LIGLSVAAAIAIVLLIVLLIAIKPTTVPDLSTKPIAEATALLEHVGLRLGTSSRVATVSAGPGVVVAQRPGALTRVPMRSSVDVTVAVAPVAADVPDVVGLTAAEAARVLADALYAPLRVDMFDQGTGGGVVLDQAPSAGTSWTTGRLVAVGVAAGPNDGTGVKVPDVKGQSLDKTMATLTGVHLNGMGFLTQITTPAANVVVDQLPEGGAVVRPGTTVLLLLRVP
jgi:serine/threonine-protein kinase